MDGSKPGMTRDTGVASTSIRAGISRGVGYARRLRESPEPKLVFLQPSAAAASGASAAITTPVAIRAPAAAASGASATVSAVPLVHVASAAVYPAAGGSQVSITPRPDSQLPDVDVSLAKNTWDFATLGIGFGVGYAVGKLPGGVIGALGATSGARCAGVRSTKKP